MRHLVFFILLGVITAAFYTIMKPFFYPLFWAAILAGIFYPFYTWLNKKIKSKNLSSLITLVLVFSIIVLPLIGVGTLVVNEAFGLYGQAAKNSVEINDALVNITNWIEHNPYAKTLHLNESFLSQKAVEYYQSFTGFLVDSATTFTQNSVIFTAMFFIMFYALFFLVRDGDKILKGLMRLIPIGDRYERILYGKFTSTVSATIKGSLVVGLVQGTLGWIMFTLAGIQGSLIWGVLMVLLATIPGIGCSIVWIPVALFSLITGHTKEGLGMLIFGVLVISTIDNFIRPLLVGKDTQLHPLMVLFSTLGGILTFGMSGFIIGPVVASLLLAFWEMYDEYFKKDLDHN